MLGTHTLELLSAVDFMKGMSSGPEISDKGYSNNNDGFNMLADPGILYAPAQAVDSDTDTVLTDEIIASAPDHQNAGTDRRAVVTEDRKYYRYNGTKLGSALTTDTDNAASNYAKGFVDMVVFEGATFITLKNNVVKWTGASTFDTTYLTSNFTNTADLHPAIVFENNLYYGDGNLLLRQTGVSSQPVTILTLPADDRIIAFGIDRGTGRMLISTTTVFNVSNILPAVWKLNWYNGNSNKVTKVVEVDDMITGLWMIGNTTFLGYGQNIGFLNGSGIEFLRKLRNVGLLQQELPYKQNFTNIGNTLYVVDGHQILAFGEVVRGQKIFRYCYTNNISADENFKAIFNAGGNKLGLSSPTSKFYTLDVTSKSSIDLFRIRTNWKMFARPIFLRGIVLEFIDAISTGSISSNSYEDQKRNGKSLVIENGALTSVKEVPVVGFGGDETDSGDSNKVTALRYTLGIGTTNVGFKRAVLYYDFAE